jgi:CzcA family heavy metal efflux pump
MWIVRIALEKPYTFAVMALLIFIMGLLSIFKTPTDIFPNINIPIVAAVWGYSGLLPEEMADRIISNYERAATTTVNDIEHIESQSLNGISVVKFYFQPTVNTDMAVAQITAISQTVLKSTPPGSTPPLIVSYNASSVPIIQLALSSPSLSESQINDLGQNFIRTQLATVQGAALPFPYGGASRQIQIDLDPSKLRSYGLTPSDVTTAIGDQNLVIPAGTEKIGNIEYNVELNGSPLKVTELNDAPIKMVNGAIIRIRDVAHVRDGSPPETNIVHLDGSRGVLMNVLKTGHASTLDVVNRVKEMLPQIQAGMPPSLKVKPIADQSIFVKAAVSGVVREAIIAACLTGLMILLFIGSWRSTLIIIVSIPLAILSSIICLSVLGNTINIMTLGGLALAVGILVDDATVEIENINRNIEEAEGHRDIKDSILEGARQIAIPALVATLSICIVFVPMFNLGGVAGYLFVPLAEAVIFAMLASYLLSRTVVPTMANYLLRGQPLHSEAHGTGFFSRFQRGFEHRFEVLRDRYHGLIKTAIDSRRVFAPAFLLVCVASLGLVMFLGFDFFPTVDAGQIKMHIRARSGLRVEDTAKLCDQIETQIRKLIPADELDNITDNIGVPNSGLNLTYTSSGVIGPQDADIQIQLTENHRPVADYMRKMREQFPAEFPSIIFSFLPADITSQILNFGLPAPVDIQVRGYKVEENRVWLQKVMQQVTMVPGATDVHMQQGFDQPQIDVDVDRDKAMSVGLTQQNVGSNLLVSLSGSFQTSPTFWIDKKTGVQYQVATQTPQYRLTTLEDLRNTPIGDANPAGSTAQLLANVASFGRTNGPTTVSHYNAGPVLDVYVDVQDTDLGSVTSRVDSIVNESLKDLPKGSVVSVRGQAETMKSSYIQLLGGLAFAIILVYLLIVVNFQSWLDPFIIITALPAALAGIVWMLFLTFTPLSVPALTGAIMCMGVATSNSILVVSFARERMQNGSDPYTAAIEAGFTRFRPVLMTALAMIIGMIPMSLGLGDGGEQNAPLGRAVIGGLLLATLSTLFFVPTVFSIMHGRRQARIDRRNSNHSGDPAPAAAH